MRPTTRGLIVAVAVPVLGLAGWLLGQPELSVGAAAAGSLLVLAVVHQAATPLALEVGRVPRPARLAAGAPCRVDLRVRNAGTRRSPVVELRDDVGAFGTATLDLAPLPAGATRQAAYAFPTDRRGVHPVGPLSATTSDPFGLVRTTKVLPGRTAVVVLPRSHRLDPLPPGRGDERDSGARALATGSTVDEELAALRPYVAGDDVRRIHWRTSARTGEPVVRQFDEPWQRRTTVLLDTRPSAHDEDSFERAVSAAASVVELATAGAELVRLVTTAGVDTGFVDGHGADDLLDRLAAVALDGRGSLTAAVSRLAGPLAPGRVVTCSGALGADEQRGLDAATRRAGVHVVVLCRSGAAAEPTGAPVVLWDGSRATPGLTSAWSRAVAQMAVPA